MIKTIGGYEFKFVEEIKPQRDENGNVVTDKFNDFKKPVHNRCYDEYCIFTAREAQGKSGVYALYIDGILQYIGSTDNLAVRWSSWCYGKIRISNCYKEGGRSTNCCINGEICKAAKEGKRSELYFRETIDYKKVEKEILNSQKTPLNIRK